ncbi:ABC transporter ATP-binding protein [Dactylosporangium fulvum]|uniref:ABC transporter ATP-binding protein/permease n=1 Tax=Dactylosporangium fulvum TaxID=53359 RepID=A0ABY5VRE4_9ACTN|nr:ABC transporter ATP-binding protein [Dactylosporangium fulvum]UWP80318.1 ABC transporter ATP-binding protein/permease [Dactylosporangium fulvum]
MSLRRIPGHVWAALRLGCSAAPVVLGLYAVLTVVAGAVPVAGAALLRAVIDGLVAGRGVLPAAAGLVAAGLGAGVLPAIRSHLHGRLLRAVGVRAMDRLYAAMNRITGLAAMENPAFRDRLRMAQQSGRAGPGQLVDDTLGAIESLILLGGFLTALIALNPLLALLAVAAAGPALLAQLRLNRRRAGMLWRVSGRARREIHYADLLTSLSAAKELRMYGLGELFRGRMRHEMAAANREQTRHDTREVLVRGALAVVTAMVAGAGLLWAITEATRGRLSIGDISLLAAALAGVQAGLAGLVDRFASTHENALLFDHYRKLVNARPDLPLPAHPAAVEPLRGAIELRDVWFRYGPDHPWVLRGVNLSIPRGQTVALVGLNGAGKSTVVKLLCRFYDPTKGSITWDGRDLRDVDVAALRERIGAVFQDYMTYELSAAENIGVGNVAALTDRPRIETAAARAGIHDTLAALPNGYDTMLTNAYYDEADRTDPTTGILLSGGQWQRLALARSFLREDRDLLVLDEPTAGLDPQAEYELHVRLRRHRERSTSVLISHRLNTIRDADRIVVLADGVVVEEGSHEDLLNRDGGYARLFRLQAGGYQPVATG